MARTGDDEPVSRACSATSAPAPRITGVAVGSAITLNGGTIRDTATNAAVLTLNDVGSTTGVLVDAIPPTVTSIDTVESSTNNLNAEDFTVTFSTSVNGVDASDFTPVGTGTASGSSQFGHAGQR